MHDELRDDISSIRRDLGTLSSQISGQEEKGSELTGRVVGLKILRQLGVGESKVSSWIGVVYAVERVARMSPVPFRQPAQRLHRILSA
jgi:hypothetical protein